MTTHIDLMRAWRRIEVALLGPAICGPCNDILQNRAWDQMYVHKECLGACGLSDAQRNQIYVNGSQSGDPLYFEPRFVGGTPGPTGF